MNLKNKKVLLVGLGILGGGIATAKWLAEQGARLTITDLKSAEYLKDSVAKLKKYDITYVLGEHREKDFTSTSLVVVNPDVPLASPFVQLAVKKGIPVENELTLFARHSLTDNQIAVTGTRGKTTTVNWIAFILSQKFKRTKIAGNSPKNPFLGVVTQLKKNDPVVLEVPSYHLELPNDVFKPKVAVITNIYRDHVNRHGSVENYAKTKMALFANQDAGDFLILNHENKWTNVILKQKLAQTIFLYSTKDIPLKYRNALFVNKKGTMIMRKDGKEKEIMKIKELPRNFGDHNLTNLMVGFIVADIFGIDSSVVKKVIADLPKILFRQEKIFSGKKLRRTLEVFNDSTATSPEATIAAIHRFKKTSFFIIGGTDKELDFKDLAKVMVSELLPSDVVFLNGSATQKILKDIARQKKWKGPSRVYETLDECLVEAKKSLSTVRGTKRFTNIVFSPSAKSFEKFKNEYDRGVQFNEIFARVFGCKTN